MQKLIRLATPTIILVIVLLLVLQDGLYLSNLVTIIAALGGLAFAMLSYLKPSTEVYQTPLTRKDVNELVTVRLEEYAERSKVTTDSKLVLSDSERADFLMSLRESIKSEAVREELGALRENILQELEQESATDQSTRSINRLGQEIQNLAKRGNLNLILGMITTLSGLAVLGYSVFVQPATTDTVGLLSFYIPRTSLVVLIEVFAYFFLRLYKQSLAEIKYFQNEITNAEFKYLALHFASKQKDPSVYGKVIEELSRVERNFILSKDQTTVELERERLSKDERTSILDALRDLLKKRGDG